jgi:predicted 3-demethylubiquinone-9 3-methyltransferase (glyoxalase superfamily)
MASLKSTQNITPCLWFDTNAGEAAGFYTSVFPNSRILSTSHYTENMHMAKGTVLTVEFELMGQRFTALNGGPHFKFSEAISLMVHCDTQAEIDEYWEKLTSDGGAEVQCGWLRDKFGLSWQIVPREVADYVHGPRSAEVMQAVMTMVKLDIAKLRAAAGK